MTTTLATLEERLKEELGDTQAIYADYYKTAINAAIRELSPSVIFENFDIANVVVDALPTNVKNGVISRVYLQCNTSPADFLQPANWQEVFGTKVFTSPTNTYLRLPNNVPSNYSLRLIGYTPLTTVVNDASTINLDTEPQITLLITYAKYRIYRMMSGVASSEDKSRYNEEAKLAYDDYKRLLQRARMDKQSPRIQGVQ